MTKMHLIGPVWYIDTNTPNGGIKIYSVTVDGIKASTFRKTVGELIESLVKGEQVEIAYRKAADGKGNDLLAIWPA